MSGEQTQPESKGPRATSLSLVVQHPVSCPGSNGIGHTPTLPLGPELPTCRLLALGTGLAPPTAVFSLTWVGRVGSRASLSPSELAAKGRGLTWRQHGVGVTASGRPLWHPAQGSRGLSPPCSCPWTWGLPGLSAQRPPLLPELLPPHHLTPPGGDWPLLEPAVLTRWRGLPVHRLAQWEAWGPAPQLCSQLSLPPQTDVLKCVVSSDPSFRSHWLVAALCSFGRFLKAAFFVLLPER